MKPATLNLDIYRGDSKDVYFRVRDKNTDGSPGPYKVLTGATPKSQIRADKNNPAVLAEFTASLDDQVARPGGVLLHLTGAQTTAITPDTAVWDVQVTHANGDVTTYLAGTVTITGDVTR